MKKIMTALAVFTICTALAMAAQADTIEMKDGRLLDGQYMGGTQHSVRFRTERRILVLRVSDILALTFSSISDSSPQRQTSQLGLPTPKPTPSDSTRRGQITLQPGAKVAVRMLDSITIADSRERDWFKGMLDKDVTVGGIVVIPEGTRVNGQVVIAKQDRSGSTLAITLREMVLDDEIIPIATHNYLAQAEQTSNTTGLGAASLKIVTRDRPSTDIPYRSVVEFETSEPLQFRIKK